MPITWNFFVLIKGRWVRARHACDTGNKHQAAYEYKVEQARNGVVVQGVDFGNAWMQWN